jgi:hypothetical protein
MSAVGYSLLLIDAQPSYYLARLVPSGISNLERAPADYGERPADDERDPDRSHVASGGRPHSAAAVENQYNMLR